MEGDTNIVYIVERDTTLQEQIEFLLIEHGYAVQSFSSVEDFLSHTDLTDTGCVLAEAEIPDVNPIELLNRLRDVDSALRLVITSDKPNVSMVVDAFNNGVSSFIEKPFKTDELLERIDRAIALSESALDEKTERKVLLKRADSLTAREKEILCMIVDGMTTKQVARELEISSRTVETHRANMMKKAGLANLADLVGFAIRAKLCEDQDN